MAQTTAASRARRSPAGLMAMGLSCTAMIPMPPMAKRKPSRKLPWSRWPSRRISREISAVNRGAEDTMMLTLAVMVYSSAIFSSR